MELENNRTTVTYSINRISMSRDLNILTSKVVESIALTYSLALNNKVRQHI
jgi:hypothetical protein